MFIGKYYSSVTFNEDIFNFCNRKSDSIWVQIESLMAEGEGYCHTLKRVPWQDFVRRSKHIKDDRTRGFSPLAFPKYKTKNLKQTQSSFKVFCGGGRGIRTPVGLHPNGFQDRLVMTTSIALQLIYSFVFMKTVSQTVYSYAFAPEDFVQDTLSL